MVQVELSKQELKMARKLLIDSKDLQQLEKQLCPECQAKLKALKKKK